MLSRKYYIKIAKILAKHKADKELINDFIDLFANDNPRFRPFTFLERIKTEKRMINLESNSVFLNQDVENILIHYEGNE